MDDPVIIILATVIIVLFATVIDVAIRPEKYPFLFKEAEHSLPVTETTEYGPGTTIPEEPN